MAAEETGDEPKEGEVPPAEGDGEDDKKDDKKKKTKKEKPKKDDKKKKTKKEKPKKEKEKEKKPTEPPPPTFTPEQQKANEDAFQALIEAMAPEPLEVDDGELEVAIAHAEEADFGMNLLAEAIAQAKKKQKEAVVQKINKRLADAKAAGDLGAIRDEIEAATEAGVGDKVVHGAHMALLEAMSTGEPLDIEWEELQAQIKASEKAKVPKSSMKNFKKRMDDAKKQQARREAAFNEIITLLAVHDLQLDVPSLEAAVKEGEAASVDELTMHDARHKVEEAFAAQKLQRTVAGTYKVPDVRDIDLPVLAAVVEEAQTAGVEKEALEEAVARLHEVETAKACMRLEYSLLDTRCFCQRVQLGDGTWVAKLRINTRCNHDELAAALQMAVTYSVPPPLLKLGKDKVEAVAREKAERELAVAKLHAVASVSPLALSFGAVLGAMAEGERLGIEVGHLRDAAAKLALAQAAQPLALAQAPAAERIDCVKLAELIANAEEFTYGGATVPLKLVMASKRKLEIAKATQELMRRTVGDALKLDKALLMAALKRAERLHVHTKFVEKAKAKLREADTSQNKRDKVTQRLQWRLEGLCFTPTGTDIEALERQIAEAEQVGVHVDPEALNSARTKLLVYAREQLATAKAEKRRVALDGSECDFYFLRADRLRAAWRGEPLPSLDELKADTQRSSWVVRKTLSRETACLGGYAAEYAAVSHRHGAGGVSFGHVLDFLLHKQSVQYLWLDTACMPAPSSDEHEGMLRNVYMLFLGASVLILLDEAYLGRFWTQFEAWLSMQKATTAGLRSATGAERRCTVALVPGTEKWVAQKLLDKWEKKPSKEVHRMLSRPDVDLSIPSDKETQLPVILKVEDVVRTIATAAAKAEEAAAKAWAEMEASTKLMQVAQVVDFLRQAPEERLRAAAALTRLAALTRVPANAQLAVELGGYPLLYRAMKALPHEARVQELGCRVLEATCSASDPEGLTRRAQAFETRLHATLCAAMAAFEASAPIQQHAAYALLHLCHGSDEGVSSRRQSVVEEAALSRVACAMWGFANLMELQEAGCALVREVVSGDDYLSEDRRQAAVDAGCLAALVQAIGTHQRKETIVLLGLSSLRCVCSAPADRDTAGAQMSRQHLTAEEGALGAIVRGMQVHSGSAAVQEEGCRALATICGGDAFLCKSAAVAEGGYVAVVKAMAKHSSSARIALVGCLALQAIAGGEREDVSPSGQQITEERQDAADVAGACKAVVRAVGTHGANQVVHVRAAGHAALQSITFGNAKLVAKAIKAGAKKEWL